MKTAIVTDSTAYIPKKLRDELSIHMIPLSVIIGGETYQEEVDLTTDDFYESVRAEKDLPTTSQPPVGQFAALFEELSADYDEIVSIHLSSGISGTFSGAVQAGEMVDGVRVFPFDSEISCMVQGMFVLEAAEMAKYGCSGQTIIDYLTKLKKTTKAYFMVDSLQHLQRGGRLSNAQAIIGSLLQVKPLLHFVDTKIEPFEKIRTRKKAMTRMVELLSEDAAKYDQLQAVIIHANREDEAHEWKHELEQQLPNVTFRISHFGPVIGTHLGEGSMGLGWMEKDAK
ncbi:DegV family protein [Jeotgalibacillus proteolyticus]|uniref:Fatty acid-binding protein DegV n=1 Tax=Jeotgalibacillus proteolyticus TaxID=2082395 RepID=A0A2S5GB87_9BACL|nr:DegV family protein [Jeotgalibacillus proteolyticus]PPA70256.1 fatty acid-binding protein DegV [Jeotgalibacillus proteolyticus]